MSNIFTDICTALKLTKEVHRARKAGVAAVTLQSTWKIQYRDFGYWPYTIEATLYYGKEFKAVRDVFKTFPEEIQRQLTFSPKNGEWPDRVRLWQNALRPVLEPKLYHAAISKLIHHGIHCRVCAKGSENHD